MKDTIALIDHLGFMCPSALQVRAGQRSITANLWPLITHVYHVMILVTSGFSKKSFFVIFRSRCSLKQVLLEILQ